MPTVHMRRTEATADNDVELTPELEQRIRIVNHKDVAVYNHVRQRLLSKRSDSLRMRGEAPAPAMGSPRPDAAAGLLHASF